MPMNSAQLAALVERARHKPPPVVSPPSPPAAQRPVPSRQAASGPPAPSTAGLPPSPAAAVEVSCDPTLPVSALPTAVPQSAHTAEAEDFPTGWELRKESWHFHRRFYAVFRRPMARGEYSHLLWQIRRRRAEHLGEDCWRVTLPDGRRTLAVRGTVWRLITILPKNWQPPAPVEEQAEIETSAA